MSEKELDELLDGFMNDVIQEGLTPEQQLEELRADLSHLPPPEAEEMVALRAREIRISAHPVVQRREKVGAP